MKPALLLASAAALVAVAACNGGGETPPANDSAVNAVAGEAAGDHAAVMHERHERYEEMGKAMKGISDQLKADQPSLDAIQRNAMLIADYAPRILTWFPAGSGPETGRETRAKAEIWTDQERFGQAAARLIAASEEFKIIAGTGNIEAIRAAVPDLGAACKNCHDRFRAPED